MKLVLRNEISFKREWPSQLKICRMKVESGGQKKRELCY